MPQHRTRSEAAHRPVQFASPLSGEVLSTDGQTVRYGIDGLPGVYEGTLLLIAPEPPARGTPCVILPTTSRRDPADPQLDVATTWVIPQTVLPQGA